MRSVPSRSAAIERSLAAETSQAVIDGKIVLEVGFADDMAPLFGRKISLSLELSLSLQCISVLFLGGSGGKVWF